MRRSPKRKTSGSESPLTSNNRRTSLNVNLSFLSDPSGLSKDDTNDSSIPSYSARINQTIVSNHPDSTTTEPPSKKLSPLRFVNTRPRSFKSTEQLSTNFNDNCHSRLLPANFSTPKAPDHGNPFVTFRRRSCPGSRTIFPQTTMDLTEVQGTETLADSRTAPERSVWFDDIGGNYGPLHSTPLPGSEDTANTVRTSMNVNTSIDSRFSLIAGPDSREPIRDDTVVSNELDGTTLVQNSSKLTTLVEETTADEPGSNRTSPRPTTPPERIIPTRSDRDDNDNASEAETDRDASENPVPVTGTLRRGQNEHQSPKKIRRKLLPLSHWSEMASFSPAASPIHAPDSIQARRLVRARRQMKKVGVNRDRIPSSCRNDVRSDERDAKQRRRVKSKPVRVKNPVRLLKLGNEEEEERSGGGVVETLRKTSLDDFEKPVDRASQRVVKKPRIVIVTTGLSREESAFVKRIVDTLGSARVEKVVTTRTTHVVSKGTRTTNVLRGIVRGCWLVSPGWVSMSGEVGKWLDPEKFELANFSKAVMENRKEKQLFGAGYVSELFLSCGPIYVEEDANPSVEILRELVKTASGQISETAKKAKIIFGPGGFKEIWILDSITNGKLQQLEAYARK